MNRAEKTAIVEELNGLFGGTPHFILASFSGLDVNGANELRSRVRKACKQATKTKRLLTAPNKRCQAQMAKRYTLRVQLRTGSDILCLSC